MNDRDEILGEDASGHCTRLLEKTFKCISIFLSAPKSTASRNEMFNTRLEAMKYMEEVGLQV